MPPARSPIVPTIDSLLRRRAADRPDSVFLRFDDGDHTFGEIDAAVDRLAGALHDAGVRGGDLVPVLLSNRVEFVVAWFALDRIGAVATLLNTAFVGAPLAGALATTGARLALVEDTFWHQLAAVLPEVRSLHTVIVLGGSTTDPPVGVEVHEFSALVGSGPPPAPLHGVADPALVLFTSGTTGVSKGCVLSHRYAVRQAQLMVEHLRLTPDDVLFCPFPLFHLDASVLTVLPALVLGTTAAIAPRFSVSRFWDDIRRTGSTVFDFMGATLTMLHKQPERPDDLENPARLAWGVPVPEFAERFEARFGLRLVELYGSTDAGIPIYQPLDEPRVVGSCGRVIPSYEIAVVDPDDEPVERGDTGELVVRGREPSLLSDGYFGRPDATIAARQNLWFHTGDLVRQDADGNVFFVGRISDSIRRRGENISAFEVEEAVKLHPDVLDVAAFGVPSELTEDEVMVAVVPRVGRALEPEQLIGFCRTRLARHMVPRFVDIVDDLPRTPTEKVEKRALRERGVGPATWDADRHRP